MLTCQARRCADGEFRCVACRLSWDAGEAPPACQPRVIERQHITRADRVGASLKRLRRPPYRKARRWR